MAIVTQTAISAVAIQFCILAVCPAAGEDNSDERRARADQIAVAVDRTVLPPRPSVTGNLDVQNDLLTGMSLGDYGKTSNTIHETAGGTADEAGIDPKESEPASDPNAPRGIALSGGVRGKFRATNGAAVFGIAID